MLKAYKVRLEPNNVAAGMFNRCIGITRLAYNWGLAEMKTRYEAGEKTSPLKLCVVFNSIKDEKFPFVRDVPYAVTEAAFRNLDAAFKNFFRRVKQGVKPGYPKFKKRGIANSFQLRGVKVFSDRVYFPKIGIVRLSQSNYIPLDADYGVYATVSIRGGNWFISILVDDGLDYPEAKPGDNALGVDVGIKTLATFSDGKSIENPKALARNKAKLSRLQRELARRKKGGANYKKTKDKISRLHFRIANVRSNATHAASNYAVENGNPIAIEDLNVAGMVKNHSLAGAVSDANMSELHRQIEYKARYAGVAVVKVGRFVPSSKTCSVCGSIKDDLTLADRVFVCADCGSIIDRDLNAARNLARIAKSERPIGSGLPGELA